MRLTLRTLLAYLDNTLEPEDAQILRAKLDESGFATQLVQRIRDSLTNRELTAPPPDSAHPIGEANVISEYLDSTLTAEQISEIERACLESEPHLAEAAACHQILTMVLGKSAEVSDTLRRRIYLLPETHEPKQIMSASFSSVSIPPDDATGAIGESAAAGESVLQGAGKTVQPVGLGDSGVSDAPTRIRDSRVGDDALQDSDAARSGSHLKVSDVYGGSVRTSRVMPWLVSLALAGALLFVLAQIFAPLLKQTTAQKDPSEERITLNPDSSTDVAPDIEAPLAETPILKPVDPQTIDVDSSDDVEENAVPGDQEMVLPAPADAPPASVEEAAPTAVETIGSDVGAAKADPELTELPEATSVDKTPIPASAADPGPTVAPAKSDAVMAKETAGESPTVPPPPPSEAITEPAPAKDGAAEPAANAAVPPADSPDQPKDGVAKAASEKTLLIGRINDDTWLRIAKDTMIGDRVMLVNAPGFRSSMVTTAGDVVTLVNATGANWTQDPDGGDTPGLNMQFGRALVTAKRPGAMFNIVLGDRPAKITMAEPDTVLGAEVQYFREPGTDPRDEVNRTRVARLFSVKGNIQFQAGAVSETLETGQQWLIKGDEVAPVAAMPAMPAWVKVADPDDQSIEAEARAGLLELIDIDQPLTLALREATAFRRSEIGALAAQTLLLLGNGSVYFGGDGMLSNPKQRAFWPAHFRAIRSFVNLNAESADALATSITEMDAADGKTLFRLLIGYSPKQLVEGGDEELVDMLESGSMAVRVMAIENLREITGTTLYYRPEEENAARRAQAVKKWRTRQRKGEVKWNAEE